MPFNIAGLFLPAAHLPILIVIIPLIAAPLCMLFGRAGLAWIISLIASVIAFLISLELLATVWDGSVISYHIGGWAPPLGIEYRVDTVNAFVLLIVSALATIVLPFAKTSIQREINPNSHTLFYACHMLVFTGLLGVTITGDAFNVFVFLEISSLSTYVLVALGAQRDKRALSVAFDYLIMGTIGATFFVIGLGLLYMATGTLNMVDMAERLVGQENNRTVQAAFAFIVVGMGLKLAFYPLHRWLPGAYSYSPSVASAFLAGTATKVAVYVLLRFVFSVFSPQFGFVETTFYFIILPFSILAMFAGSIVAFFQVDIKRLLAYSSIAQIGYILVGVSILSSDGTAAAIVHLFNHALTKTALFLAVGAIVYQTGNVFVARMQGLGKQMPWTGAAMVIGGLSLIGIPGTAGFISKWALIKAALDAGWWPLAFAIVASSMIAVAYVGRILNVMYLQPAPEGQVASDPPFSMLLSIWVLTIATIYFGLYGEWTLAIAQTAANALLDGTFGADGAVVFGNEGR